MLVYEGRRKADGMAENDTRPLTSDERAELEALRAEKARREEERIRRERAELEALRAEQQVVEQREAAAAPAPAPAPKSSATESSPSAIPVSERTFGQRMVLSDGEDDDGIPKMPPAQKITIALCFVLAACIVGYFVLSNLGML